jgi:hypothetical protein
MRRAIIFWEASGYWFVETPYADAQPIGPYEGNDSLDDAITAAKTAGFKIAGVRATRGLLPAPGPKKPQDKEVLSGNGSA